MAADAGSNLLAIAPIKKAALETGPLDQMWLIGALALIPRQADNPRPTVTVAARAANIVECNADWRVGIAAFHCQVEIDDGVAGIARDDEPVCFDASAAAIVGQNHAVFFADSRALNCLTMASASSYASRSRRIRSRFSWISSLRAL
jgi:hypothetical protein